MRPLVGIIGDHATNLYGQPVTELTEAYSRAIADAGGVPVLIPAVLDEASRSELLPRLDGILFSGGGDIEPLRYGEQHVGRLVDVHAPRDELELDLLHMAIERRKPLLGICRGCQLMNVGLGGTLYPDLRIEPGSAITHDLPGNERDVLVHDVKIEEGSRLAKVVGETILRVNSHHHQGLKVIARDLHIAARAPDGLVEAVELPEHPFALAVQWHPEWLTNQQSTVNLFRRFVDAAAISR
jgi:putative glutamine amidotransferase